MVRPAASIATVVSAMTVHPKRELGWPFAGRHLRRAQVRAGDLGVVLVREGFAQSRPSIGQLANALGTVGMQILIPYCVALSFTFRFGIEEYGLFAAYGAYPCLTFEVRPLVIVLAS